MVTTMLPDARNTPVSANCTPMKPQASAMMRRKPAPAAMTAASLGTKKATSGAAQKKTTMPSSVRLAKPSAAPSWPMRAARSTYSRSFRQSSCWMVSRSRTASIESSTCTTCARSSIRPEQVNHPHSRCFTALAHWLISR